jgi:hypothetical protein
MIELRRPHQPRSRAISDDFDNARANANLEKTG